ncbi:hypothetical protein M5689_015310 [Euphorbia peplus]|nr:hypothetical protein M5689_015310 [Euphorbia peplus]
MRRGRGKGRKQNVVSSHEDHGSGEEEKVPAYRRRGRPLKPLKDDYVEEEAVEFKEDGVKDGRDSVSNNDVNTQDAIENGRKRKKTTKNNAGTESLKEENGDVVAKLTSDNSTISIGFRQNGSRRKNKPRRAAEAVVECK